MHIAFRHSFRAFLLPALIVAIVALACSTSQADPHIGGTVRVVGSWSGAEQDAFLAMVRPFEQQTGVSVEYTGTRDLNGLLWQGVAQKNPPDVAGLPGPGQMAEFARFGALQDLTNVIDVGTYKKDTVPTFIDLGTVDGCWPRFAHCFRKPKATTAATSCAQCGCCSAGQVPTGPGFAGGCCR